MNTRQQLRASLALSEPTMGSIAKHTAMLSLRAEANRAIGEHDRQLELAILAATGGDTFALAMHIDHASRSLSRAAKALKALHENEAAT